MRYAFMSASVPTASIEEMCRRANELGYEGIEPRTESGHAHGVEVETSMTEREAIRATAERAGMSICCVAVSSAFADPMQAPKAVGQASREIDLAADVGCPRLRVFGGDHKGVDREAAVDSMIRSLSSLADHAAERGVTICVETHDAWCEPQALAGVTEAVNHPAIAVNWDVMHTQRQGGASMAEAYARLKPWIRHVHIHDGLDTLERLLLLPIGTGDFDHSQVLRLLKADGYDGYLSGEWIEVIMSEAFFANHLRPEIATLRQLEALA